MIHTLALNSVLAALTAAIASVTPALSGGKDGGALLFEPCRACHALAPEAKAMAGPNLSGLIGRRVAGDADFDYSPVLRRAGAEGRRWDRPMLDAFLADPEAMFPGMWMTGRRMPDAAEREALGAFIAAPSSR